MKIELLGALDYNKLEEALKGKVENVEEIIYEIKNLAKGQKTNVVATAARLSRFPGNVFEVLNISEQNSYEKNVNFIKRVIGMGHDSITDHDYLVFGIENVSALIEQMIIAERFSSFTIKSRREVDFTNAGFYIPNFHDENGVMISNNNQVKEEYQKHMKSLFQNYGQFVNQNMKLEDARFILPYCYYSNIMMGIDAHTLKDMIIKFTKTKYAKIEELRLFGERLKEIAEQSCEYILDEINKAPLKLEDGVDEFLNSNLQRGQYQVLDRSKLLNHTENTDDVILMSALMRRYQYNHLEAKRVLDELSKNNPEFKQILMHKIAFESDRLEFTQVNFQFQLALSYAILTHLTRHRTHDIIFPDFAPIIDLMQYKIPPTLNEGQQKELQKIFKNNFEVYQSLKEQYHIREEDLVYFTLSGNMCNILTNMNGWDLRHILELRMCNKAQWETRAMANGMYQEVSKQKDAELFSSILGPTCVTKRVCNEGKESCGRILKLLEQDQREV